MAEKKGFVEIEFHYADLTLQPYANDSTHSGKILKEIIEKMNNNTEFPDSERVIPRYPTNRRKRRLVNLSASMASATRCFGKIALIKEKAPQIWSGKDIIEEIEKDENKKFIETTNYVIHFSPIGEPIIMVEFNHAGPRLSDIEFYLGKVAKKFKISKSISSTFHLDIDYKNISKELENVFNLAVKVRSNEIGVNGVSWHKPFKVLKDEAGYADVRMEMFFRRAEDKERGGLVKNIQGMKYVREIFDWLGKDKKNIKQIEDLKMSYMVSGSDEIQDLDFIKNKTTSAVHIPVNDKGLYSNPIYREIVGKEFTHYNSTGTTHND